MVKELVEEEPGGELSLKGFQRVVAALRILGLRRDSDASVSEGSQY